MKIKIFCRFLPGRAKDFSVPLYRLRIQQYNIRQVETIRDNGNSKIDLKR
jgi:hypothetical protein